MGNFGQREAQNELHLYDSVVDVKCYELAALFLCSIFVPKCGTNGHVVPPCRSLCIREYIHYLHIYIKEQEKPFFLCI